VDTLRDGRLPRSVVPKRYDLTLAIDPERGEFSGVVTIDLEIREATRRIIVHAVDLQIAEGLFEDGALGRYAEISLFPDLEAAAFTFAQELPTGPGRLKLRFSGHLNQQMKGLYEARADGERYAFTQFEATDARRAFPCFDEPGFKASFRITAEFPEDLMALSNMERESEERDISGRRKRVTFKETPPMSTYLVALGIARLVADEFEIEGTHVAIYTRPELAGLTGFAKEVMRACLPKLNEYFGLKYPISKLDLVGVPDFAMGAMENWGAIFFRENRLLVDVAKASANSLRGVANVITHEVVHQWFGNLVTMWWWDDLWLNESFATWLACKIVDDWRPEWQSWVEFARDKQVPLGVDALRATRPISSKVRTAAEAEEMFDALTYEKGASVLRMLEQFLGEEMFRQGIRDYIASHLYGNAPASDLWQALEKASGQPVSTIANDWFTKPGFPMVTAKAPRGDSRKLQLEQRRFVADATAAGQDNAIWAIPISLAYEDEEGIHKHRILMTESHVEVLLPTKPAVRWVYANASEQGYYRTRYDEALYQALCRSLPSLSSEERFGFLDNTWALAHQGEAPIGTFLDLVRLLRGHDTRIVIEALAGFLETINDRVVLKPDRPRLGRFVADRFDSLSAELGWTARPSEGDEPKLTRAALLWILGTIARPPELLTQVDAWLDAYWRDPGSLDPTFVPPVIRLGARSGDHGRFLRYVEQYLRAVAPEERDRYVVAFGDFSRPEFTDEILELILSDKIRGQDVWKPLRVMLANPATQAETWSFIQANWAALRTKGGSVGAQRIIGGTKALWREGWIREVESFFRAPENHVASADRVLTQTLEVMCLGLAFRRLQQENLSQWLRSNYD
jgi:puromycin-sensitive aminopeptidase